jgi:glutamate-1-semialdehyde 2,1-aminomutase
MIKKYELPIEVKGLPVHFVLVCKDKDGQESLVLKSLLIQEMCKRGILMGGYFNICYMHKNKEIKKTLKAIDETFKVMKQAVSTGNTMLEGAPVQPVFRRQ